MSQLNHDVEITNLSSDAQQQTLAVRLKQSHSRGCLLVGAWIFGLLMGGITGAIVSAAVRSKMPEFALLVFSGVLLGLLAALLLWSAIQQTLALSIPTTVVEIEREPVEPGATIRFCVKQPGPAYLSSMRANLVCSQRKEQRISRGGQSRLSRAPDKILHHENILDADGGWLFPAQTRQWTSQLTIPQDAVESGKEGSLVTQWQIEIWGRAQGIIGFRHAYDLQIRHSP